MAVTIPPWLALNPYVVVWIACGICPSRQGSYRLARLAARYGPETSLEEVLVQAVITNVRERSAAVRAHGSRADSCRKTFARLRI